MREHQLHLLLRHEVEALALVEHVPHQPVVAFAGCLVGGLVWVGEEYPADAAPVGVELNLVEPRELRSVVA